MITYLCPSEKKYQCSWEGQAEDILDHFEKEHDDLVHYSENFDIDLGIPKENILFFLDEEIYLTQVIIDDSNFILKLRYLGPKTFARNISYSITVSTQNETFSNEFIKPTPEGFLSIDLSALKQCHPDLEILNCQLNITKLFTDDVFDINDQLSTHSTKYAKGKDTDKPINNETLEKEKVLTYEVKEIKINDHITHETKVEEDYSTIKTVQSDTKELREAINLSRSHSTAFEVKRKKWSRSSTMSLNYPLQLNNFKRCTKCAKPLRVWIYLCEENHPFCEFCQPGDCNVCHRQISEESVNASEELLGNYNLLSCQYRNYGCPDKLTSEEIHEHEVHCPFCVYRCPIDGCLYEGPYKALCNHFKIVHPSTPILFSLILNFNRFPEAFMVDENKGVFYCYVKYGTENVEWCVKFCGPKERIFFCELKFKDGKIKSPILLVRNDNVYSTRKSIIELKKMKVKVKHAVLAIT